MTSRGTLSLLDVDPDLAQLLPDDRRAAARRHLQVKLHRIAAGPWDVGRLAGTHPENVGLLLFDGVLAREVLVSNTVSTELLGPGDVIRPWAILAPPPLLELSVRWVALTETRGAVLDRSFGERLVQWPEVNSVLIDRLDERAQRLAAVRAISQLNRVDRRLLALFWHLAERWGRMTSEGVAVPLTLSHRMLGQLVGACRPTVTTALARLASHGELVRRGDGSWLLKGTPVTMASPEAQRIVPPRRRLLAPAPADAADPRRVPDVYTTARRAFDGAPMKAAS
jgi:CRP/FNR family cyclic AMP-dependent transcriptional regulator